MNEQEKRKKHTARQLKYQSKNRERVNAYKRAWEARKKEKDPEAFKAKKKEYNARAYSKHKELLAALRTENALLRELTQRQNQATG